MPPSWFSVCKADFGYPENMRVVLLTLSIPLLGTSDSCGVSQSPAASFSDISKPERGQPAIEESPETLEGFSSVEYERPTSCGVPGVKCFAYSGRRMRVLPLTLLLNPSRNVEISNYLIYLVQKQRSIPLLLRTCL